MNKGKKGGVGRVSHGPKISRGRQLKIDRNKLNEGLSKPCHSRYHSKMAASSSTAGSEADGPVTHPGVQSHRSKVSFRGLTGADSPVSYDSPSQMQSDGEEDVDPKNASKKQRSKKPSQQQQHHHHNHHHSQHRHPSRHDFPYSASSSVADLSLLAGLVDDRSGWCEGNRISEEEIGARCNGKKRAVRKGLQEYYENLNYVLDGWRQADIVVDSQVSGKIGGESYSD